MLVATKKGTASLRLGIDILKKLLSTSQESWMDCFRCYSFRNNSREGGKAGRNNSPVIKPSRLK